MSKKQVVLLPALLCTPEIFINQIHALQSHADFHTPDTAKRADIASLAKDILDGAPERFALAGISMGGYVAFEILRQAPERVTDLILMDTSALPDAPEKRAKRAQIVELAKTRGIESVVPAVLQSLLAPQYRDLSQLGRFMTFMAQTIGVQGFANQQSVIASRPDSTDLLGQIDIPTTVIGGVCDEVTPIDKMRELAAQIPHARFVPVADSGHLPPLENPAAVTRIFQDALL